MKTILKFNPKNERQILKAFLLVKLYQLLCEKIQIKLDNNTNKILMECYEMDGKVIKLLIHGIIETGEYTLEGIAFYTRIPFDVIYDAATGINNHISITPWAKLVDLYMQVKPDTSQMLIEKLLELSTKNKGEMSMLLSEGC